MAENNIASNEEALNKTGQTSDVSKTDGTNSDVEELKATGSAQIATGDAPVANDNAEAELAPIPSNEDAISSAVAETQKLEADIEGLAEKRITEDAKIGLSEKASIITSSDKKDSIVKTRDDSLAAIEEKASAFSQDTTDKLTTQLEDQKRLALNKSELTLEEQKITNSQAIDKAEREVSVQQQKATWAMNDLGLGFGNGIIQEVQAIATRGATEIAKLKVTAKKLEADTELNISKVEFEYSKEINSMISSNLETQLGIDERTAQRISDTQNSYLLTETEKADAIIGIKKDYLASSRATEDGLRTEQERLTDKYVGQVQEFNNQITEKINNGKTKINDGITSGAIYNATSAQLVKMAADAGISLNELESIKTNQISGQIISTGQIAMNDKSFIFKQEEKLSIINNAKELMSGGTDFKTAVQSATTSELKSNTIYKNIQKTKSLDVKNQIMKMTKSLNPTAAGEKAYVPKASDINKTILADGRVSYTNKITQQTFIATEGDGTTVLVPSGYTPGPTPNITGINVTEGQMPLKARDTRASSGDEIYNINQ